MVSKTNTNKCCWPKWLAGECPDGVRQLIFIERKGNVKVPSIYFYFMKIHIFCGQVYPCFVCLFYDFSAFFLISCLFYDFSVFFFDFSAYFMIFDFFISLLYFWFIECTNAYWSQKMSSLQITRKIKQKNSRLQFFGIVISTLDQIILMYGITKP
jgi:hypothetical protein